MCHSKTNKRITQQHVKEQGLRFVGYGKKEKPIDDAVGTPAGYLA